MVSHQVMAVESSLVVLTVGERLADAQGSNTFLP